MSQSDLEESYVLHDIAASLRVIAYCLIKKERHGTGSISSIERDKLLALIRLDSNGVSIPWEDK